MWTDKCGKYLMVLKNLFFTLSVQTSYFIYCTKLSLCAGTEYQCSVTHIQESLQSPLHLPYYSYATA